MNLNTQCLIEELKTRLGIVLNIAELGFWDFSPTAEVLNWSDRAKSFFGLSGSGEMTYDKFLSSVHSDDRERVRTTLRSALKSSVAGYTMEFRTIGIEDHKERCVWARGVVQFGFDGRPTRIIGASLDLTERKRMEHELRLSQKKAESANESKTQFLANMSHEIRTPLGAIIGFTDLALAPTSTDVDRLRHLKAIHRNSVSLLRLVNQVLDLSKIEANKIEIERKNISISSLIADVVSALSGEARKKGVELCVSRKDEVPRYLLTDPFRLKQILLNIVGNAVKFTDHGRVKLSSQIVRSDSCTKVKLIIEDNGVGIEPQKHERIFERFTQSDSSTTRKFGGSGLGLSLSKQLAVALGGDLTLEWSILGKGSAFAIEIPISAGEEVALTHLGDVEEGISTAGCGFSKTSFLKGMKVLLAEDSLDNQELISEVLAASGAEVEIADNGAQAIAMAIERSYDLILMDIQMPEVDGIKATERLRQNGYTKPIVALTANSAALDRIRSFEQGFDDYITKPVNIREVVQRISRFRGISGVDRTFA